MKYFKYSELLKSETAVRLKIENRPTAKVLDNLQRLVENVLDPLREKWGSPIIVTSGYRCPRLNAAVGGVKNSQHITGEAADITATDKWENLALYELCKKMKLPIDQCIWEKGSKFPQWIHISHSQFRCRQQFFRK